MNQFIELERLACELEEMRIICADLARERDEFKRRAEIAEELKNGYKTILVSFGDQYRDLP